MIRHPFSRDDIDLSALRDALATRLGQPVELLTGKPTDVDPNGVLIVEHPDTGEYLDVDAAVVAQVVAAQPVVMSLDEQAIAQFDAAQTVVGKLQAWRDHLGRRVAADRQRKQRMRSLVADAQAQRLHPRREA